MEIISKRTPWTPEEVAMLKAWQSDGYMHPYTCRNDCGTDLTPTTIGWYCETCKGITQTWAHLPGEVAESG